MNILIICHRIPFPSTTDALSFRVLASVKYLSKKYNHNITVAAFKYKDDSEEYLKYYCDEIVTINIPTSNKKKLTYYIINYIEGVFLREISFKRGNYLCYSFSWKLQKKINRLLRRNKFDVIFVDDPSMVFYVSDVNLSKVVEIWTVPQAHYEACKKLEKKIHKKIYRLMHYFNAKNCEKKYAKFDVCITPTEHDRDVLKSYLPDLEIAVIPYGINVEFTNKTFIEDFPSLIFIGSMGSLFNQRSILYFYDKIYPQIKETLPEIKLYIVGRDPSEKIMQLARDKSVIVTGYVEDLRPYLARASVVTLPIHGYGIKTRILEAMAMGKSVVTSSEGIHGIDVTPGENIIIADEPKEFAGRVIELLNDEELRNKIGTNARKLMEEEYSWEKMTDKLNDVFQRVVNKR